MKSRERKEKIEKIYKLANAYTMASKLPTKTIDDVRIKTAEMNIIMERLVELYLNSQDQPEENIYDKWEREEREKFEKMVELTKKRGKFTVKEDRIEFRVEDTPEDSSWKEEFETIDYVYDVRERGGIGRGLIDPELKKLYIEFIENLLKNKIKKMLETWK